MTHSVGLRAQLTVVTVWSTWLYVKRFISPRRWCTHHLGLCKRFPSTCPSTASIDWSCRNLALSYRRCRLSSRRGCWVVVARRHELDICTEAKKRIRLCSAESNVNGKIQEDYHLSYLYYILGKNHFSIFIVCYIWLWSLNLFLAMLISRSRI